jgi:hypothetical protein
MNVIRKQLTKRRNGLGVRDTSLKVHDRSESLHWCDVAPFDVLICAPLKDHSTDEFHRPKPLGFQQMQIWHRPQASWPWTKSSDQFHCPTPRQNPLCWSLIPLSAN